MNQRTSLSAAELQTLSEDELETVNGGKLELAYKPFPRGILEDLYRVPVQVQVPSILERGIPNPQPLGVGP